MAKRKQRRPSHRRENLPEDVGAQEFSLEDILTEYRLSVAEPEARREEAISEPLHLEDSGDDILTARVTEPEASTAPAEENEPLWEEEENLSIEPPYEPEEDVLDDMYTPEELTPWVDPGTREEGDAPPIPEEEKRPEETYPEETAPEALSPEEPSETAAEEEPLTEEGYDDDADFYAGPTEEPESGSGENKEESASPESAANPRRSAPQRGPLGSIWEKLTGLLAMASYKRELRRRQAPPEPENSDKEMPPDKAARYYASQMPALRLRSFGALGVCLLLCWLTVGNGLGGGLPGNLAWDVRLAAIVLLVGQITVMLLALDIMTAGIMALVRGRPGAETLLAVASLASAVDTLAILLSNNAGRGIPYGAVTSLGLFFALRGAWHFAKGSHDTFLTVFKSEEPVTLSQEELPEGEKKVILPSRRETAGFVRRSEEPGEAELLASLGATPMLIGSGALALAAALGSKDPGAFFHIFALMTALCAGFGWLFSYPWLFSAVAGRLMTRGSALAGWSGARDLGSSRRLVIRDTDIFPEDAMEITGIRLLDKSKAQYIIACTGTMLSTAGTATARVFTELMRRHKAAMQTVEDFSIGEGGCKGVIQYQEVRVGSLGYMYLSGVKVPDKLKANNAVYTAIGGELIGVFLFRYRPMGSVQRALLMLRRKYRRPLFLARDFNIDPHMIREFFGISIEGFEFPPFPERYQISASLAESKSPLAGLTVREGLDLTVDLCESGTQLYQLGRISAWTALGSALFGMALMFIPCWLGNWGMIAAWRVLAYALLWLLPTAVFRLLLRKPVAGR